VVSFLVLTVGFLAGYLLRGDAPAERPASGAPHPVGVEEYVQLGMRALAAGDYGEAERRFGEAVKLSPEDPNLRVDLAVAFMSQGDWERAEGSLSEAKRMAPELPAVWFLEGWVARDGFADTVRARAAWQRFLELAPADAPQAAEVRQWLETGISEAPIPGPGGAEPEGGSGGA
jgi:Tfp pilus assembly protein PilF